MSNAHEIAYYPGCSQVGTAVEYDISTRAVARALGLTLKDVEDWSCCGSTPAHSRDKTLMAALAARNLRLAQSMGLEQVATPCPSCLAALKTACEFTENKESRQAMNSLLDAPLENAPACRSILQVLLEDVGLDTIKEKAVRPLKGLNAVPYYGCLLTRPGKLMQFDDQEHPVSMDKIMSAAGAQVLDFPFKVECCGVSFGVTNNESVTRLSGRILDMAVRVGAQAVVVACPLCHQNLDLRQKQAARANKTKYNLPILYITQVVGLALGLSPAELGLDKHAVSTGALVKSIFAPAAEEAKA